MMMIIQHHSQSYLCCRSLFNRYFNPMPMLLTPFEVKVDVAGITKITINWDMHKTR